MSVFVDNGAPGLVSMVLSGADVTLAAIAASDLTLDASKRLGIGIATPAARLHVKDSATYKAAILESSHVTGAAFNLKPTASVNSCEYSFLATDVGATAGPGCFAIYNESQGQYRFVITPAGNIGIGTITPAAKLHVNGSIKASALNLAGLPTSSAGLSTGDVWNDGGTLKIV